MTKSTFSTNALSLGLFFLLGVLPATVEAGGNFSLSDAENSITIPGIKEHVNVLASDTFEGREAGSQGGQAAGDYLGEQFQKYKLAGGASERSYYQPFQGNYRNILGILHGADPVLKDEVVVISAHYDHVGYGNGGNSRGPTGYIHNGADDNASGTAGLIEIVEAISGMRAAPRRTILFALWDAEEKGMWGSEHWINSPTVPRDKIKILINADMIGRLRNSTITCYGSRTSLGLRRIVTGQNRSADLKLDYTWELPDNSDHWPFITRQVPALMFHTGLHDDYHTPNDDLDKLNYNGIRDVARIMFHVAWELANRDEIAPFRPAAFSETTTRQQQAEAPLPPRRSRLGVTWSEAEEPRQCVRLDSIRPGSAADKAGLSVGDRIVEINGMGTPTGQAFLAAVLEAENPAEFTLLEGEESKRTVTVTLDESPVRLGITWRTDPADPKCVVVSRVIPGSRAARAGLRLNDRIYRIGEQEIADGQQLTADAFYQSPQLKIQLARQGQLQTVEIKMPATPAPANK